MIAHGSGIEVQGLRGLRGLRGYGVQGLRGFSVQGFVGASRRHIPGLIVLRVRSERFVSAPRSPDHCTISDSLFVTCLSLSNGALNPKPLNPKP